MSRRAEGFYWAEAGAGPEVALWHAGKWWFTGAEVGFPPVAVAVLSGPLLPPGPMPRVAVAWGVPPGAGEAASNEAPKINTAAVLPDDSGVLHGGGA